MKVGLITFHRANNYGAVLQAYALQQAVLSLGHECEIVDYRNRHIENVYKLFRLDDFAHPKGLLHKISYLKRNYLRKQRFGLFRNTYLKLSANVFDQSNIEDAAREYDFFITGSDQVWNGNLTGADDTYFMNFAPDFRKGSYAASIGKVDESLAIIFENALKGYCGISVREEDAQRFLRDKCSLTSEVVLDPTLLLGAEKWQSLVEHVSGEYVLVFLMNRNDELINKAVDYARERGLSVKYINLYDKKIPSEVEGLYGVSVNQWLGYIHGAQCVFTNSFHCIAFSIIFEKNFFYEMLRTKNAPNSRFQSLIKLSGIGGRDVSELSRIQDCQDIDYHQVKKNINKERERSMSYLRRLLEGEK